MDFRTGRISRDGNPIHAPTFEDSGGLHPQWIGYKYVATAGATSIFDVLVTTEKQLRGGWYELLDSNSVLNDYIEFAVVDKDDVLGLFSLYGLTVGEDILELQKYVKTEYVNPVKKDRQMFMGNGTFIIMAGLYLRTIYESEGESDVTFKVVLHVFE